MLHRRFRIIYLWRPTAISYIKYLYFFFCDTGVKLRQISGQVTTHHPSYCLFVQHKYLVPRTVSTFIACYGMSEDKWSLFTRLRSLELKKCFHVDSRWCHWIFCRRNLSDRTMVQWSTQPVTEMGIRNISWGVKAGGAYGWQSYRLPVPIVMKPVGLDLLEPSGPVQADCFNLYMSFLASPEIHY
jgi:hypothetical protein